MTIRLVDAGWRAELIAALRTDNREFRIICPFIKVGALNLSAEGISWLGEQHQAAFDTHGKVPQDTLYQLDWPTLPELARGGGG